MNRAPLATDFRNRTPLGRSGLSVSRLGLGSSYGLGTDGVEEAYDSFGINLLYWGSIRRPGFGEGIRRVARHHRDDIVIVLQSFSRSAIVMRLTVDLGLRRLKLDHADLLLLGWHNGPISPRILDAAEDLRARGRVRFLAVSCHHRPAFEDFLKSGVFDAVMFRYNAAHRGAESEVLPLLRSENRPGTIAFTATRWGQLLDPSRMPANTPPPRSSDCYRFALTQPEVDVCLIGPANQQQLREAAITLEKGPMTEEELAEIRRIGNHLRGGRP